jgi:hypothetical protein
VHNTLHAATSTYDDGPLEQLAYGTTGITNSFTISARDTFGNLRHGDSTAHFYGYGNGNSDYFLVEFTQTQTNDYYRVSTAIDIIQTKSLATAGYFRLSFGGRTTLDIPSSVSAAGLEAILESLHDYQLDVRVKYTASPSAGIAAQWSVQFLTMLNVWQSMPPSGLATGSQLKVLAPASGSLPATFFNTLSIVRPASLGVYPVSFTLWNTGNTLPVTSHFTLFLLQLLYTSRSGLCSNYCIVLAGTYNVSISNNGVDIQGSPTSIAISNAPVDPTSSYTTGQGDDIDIDGKLAPKYALKLVSVLLSFHI